MKKILFCSINSQNNVQTAEIVFEIAQKFHSEVIFLKCLYKDIPRFGLFQTKYEKNKIKKIEYDTKRSLEEMKKFAKNYSISMEYDFSFTESLSDYIVSYAHNSKVDLVVIDSSSGDFDYEESIHKVYKNIDQSLFILK